MCKVFLFNEVATKGSPVTMAGATIVFIMTAFIARFRRRLLSKRVAWVPKLAQELNNAL